MFDFRSDTVTLPDRAMRDVMAHAEVGDDVYGEDTTAHQLEEQVAALLGKQAGLFVSSGTQSNLIAMLTHAGRGEEVISGQSYHTLQYEAGGIAALGGVIPCPLPVNAQGSLEADDISAAVKEDDSHFPISRLLCLENTHNGLVQSPEQLARLCAIAREHDLHTHLDGARLMNAVVASNRAAADFTAPFDSVSLCLSKGLAAPIGSVLVGSTAFINRARRLRKMLGGGMRQVGVMASAGLYALNHNVARLSEDHHRAKTLALNLSAINGVEIDQEQVQTNMVYMRLSQDVPQALKTALPKHLKAKGVIISPAKKAFRLVIHKDIPDAGIDTLCEAVADILGDAAKTKKLQ